MINYMLLNAVGLSYKNANLYESKEIVF